MNSSAGNHRLAVPERARDAAPPVQRTPLTLLRPPATRPSVAGKRVGAVVGEAIERAAHGEARLAEQARPFGVEERVPIGGLLGDTPVR